MTCQFRDSVAAYALGTLDPTDRAQVATHLPGCAECQAVLDSIAGLPGLLARIRPAEVLSASAAPDEGMFDRLLAAAVTQRRARHRRLVIAAAAAALVLAGTGVGADLAVDHWRAGRSGPAAVAVAGPVQARVWLHPSDAGTGLTLELTGVAPEQRCRLLAVDTAGHQEVAATWEATYSGQASINGSTAIPQGQLSRLVVETTDHRILVTIPLAG